MSGLQSSHSTRRRVRVCCFNTWATGIEDAVAYLARVPQLDLRPFVTNPGDRDLMTKARLDRDWYAENVRCFSSLVRPEIEFLPGWVSGPQGLLEVVKAPRAEREERWVVFTGHQPQSLGPMAEKAFRLLAGLGVRFAFYAFDEASRHMPCFREIAPHLSVVIHDESPLDPAGEKLLSAACLRIHRSWVANVVPFTAPFNEKPEAKIVFLGSQLGLTPNRERQIAHLSAHFKDRFTAIRDHSLAVGDRFSLNRYAVSLCPEGRKFTTPAMSRTHTDRPFWSGCLGLVPVSEDSKTGGRLDELAASGMILRYPYGDLKALTECCERALAMSTADRRKIYDYFNRNETVGTVVAGAMAQANR